MEPWLSVIIPTFNGEHFLRSTLATTEAQNLAGVELIVVDDGSTDRSLEIVREFARRLPITILANEHRGNWVASTNEGIRNAKGEWITFLHQDDGWEPSRLARLRDVVARHPTLQFVVHDAWFADQHGHFVGPYSPPWEAGRLLRAEDVLGRLIIQNTIAISCVAFRRDAFLSIGAMDEAWLYTADWKLWMNLAALGATYHLPEALGFFRIHVDSQTSKMSKSSATFLLEHRHVQEEFAGLVAKTVEDSPRYLAAARFNSYGNVILAAAWSRNFRACGALLKEVGVPSVGTVSCFLQYSRFWQRIRPRLQSFIASKRAEVTQ
jgi:glycosyltransferase involved in cell wall biosynthesis